MSEKLSTLSYTLDDKPVTITALRATAKIGVRRFRMMIEADTLNKLETDEDLKPLRLYTFPDLVCGTEKVVGLEWPMPFEKFADLPEDFVNRWADLVYRMNPQWRSGMQQEDGETSEKKEPTSKSISATT
jgi:hypothetical protein